MEIWVGLVIGGIWLAVWLLTRIFGSGGSATPSPSSEPSHATAPNSKGLYRPRPSSRRDPRIIFENPKGGSAGPIPTLAALEGLHDAFTGAPLEARLGLHQCRECKVYYHSSSVDVLREENASRCVSCGTGSIVALTAAQAKTSRGFDYNPNAVTLANYRSHFDRVVTFEGTVQAVKTSRRGLDYAVMFDNASWTKGLKLVFFRGAVHQVGGAEFIEGLSGRFVRVRGLLINHQRFGPEIIISERAMILEVSS